MEQSRKCLIAAPDPKASRIKITTICSLRVRENINNYDSPRSLSRKCRQALPANAFVLAFFALGL